MSGGTVTTMRDQPLDVADVDVESLILARNDGHPDGDWWFDPRTGESLYYGVDDDTDLPALIEGVHVLIPDEPQPATDIEDFLDIIVDEEAALELYRAFHRKGGQKRFRELVDRTAVGEQWRAFMLEREGARALSWLRARGLVLPDNGIEC